MSTMHVAHGYTEICDGLPNQQACSCAFRVHHQQRNIYNVNIFPAKEDFLVQPVNKEMAFSSSQTPIE